MMSDAGSKFELARDIEHYIAVLSKLYKHDGKTQKLAIIVNAQIRVHEEWTYDNWNGGTYGHALYLTVPEDLYLRSVAKRQTLQKEICSDLNEIHNVQDEHIAEVFLEIEKREDGDWRQESGALESPLRIVTPEASLRVWGDTGYKVFLSHKTEVKKKTAAIKDALKLFGISAFVAHEDIHPTKAWQEEIENALTSMNSFVALLSENFHESNWTDQEVGFALGRGVPVVCVKLGRDPYGFIGKFQALSCSWAEAPVEIAKLLISDPAMVDAYIEALPRCRSFEEGITLSQLLPAIKKLTDEQVDRMMLAFNTDSQLRGSWGFNGARPNLYGDGLAVHLSRITGRNYVVTSTGEIERKKRQ
jgi:TIR domain